MFEPISVAIPQDLKDLIKTHEMDKGGGSIVGAFYNKDTKKYIVVMDNGWYYKVGAKYMTWHWEGDNEKPYGKCNWSQRALNKTIQALLAGKPIPFDPDYQT